jgi:hypothetical protein
MRGGAPGVALARRTVPRLSGAMSAEITASADSNSRTSTSSRLEPSVRSDSGQRPRSTRPHVLSRKSFREPALPSPASCCSRHAADLGGMLWLRRNLFRGS